MNRTRNANADGGPSGANRVRALLVCAMLAATTAVAQNEPVLIAAWDASVEANNSQIDHGAWQEILDVYLHSHESGINRVDYAALRASTENSEKLTAYLAYLQGLDPRQYSRQEQKAYWINFYNALTVKVVADAYPVDSIREISDSVLAIGGLVPIGPWGDVRASVAGLDLTLDDIEHGILRPIWGDERIHYAVNCASLGCPNLLPTAYSADNIEALLEAGASEYVNHPRGVDFVDEDFIVISSIYDWWVADFGGNHDGVMAHLLRYADEDLAALLRGFDGVVEYEYDWDLNQP